MLSFLILRSQWRRPNHQIVECYIVFTSMEAAKKNEDPFSKVLPDLSCHGIFEKWRVVDTTQLDEKEQAEYEENKKESNRRYEVAYAEVLSHTSKTELQAFWDALGGSSEGMHSDSDPTQVPMDMRTLTSTPPEFAFVNPIFGTLSGLKDTDSSDNDNAQETEDRKTDEVTTWQEDQDLKPATRAAL
jgi:hypothetical protein